MCTYLHIAQVSNILENKDSKYKKKSCWKKTKNVEIDFEIARNEKYFEWNSIYDSEEL